MIIIERNEEAGRQGEEEEETRGLEIRKWDQ